MTDQPTPAALSARDVLRIPTFRRLWLGQLVSEAGDGLTNLALLLLVNHLTGSTAAIAAMAICLAIPPLTIGLFAGAYVDRADRRRIMLASDLLRAGTVLGFVLVGSPDELWLLFILAFVQASVGTFFTPARGAVLPKVVPREGLLAANSIAQATRVVSGIVGAGLGGLLIGLAGVYWPAFVIDSLSFLASFVLILGLPAGVGAISTPTGTQAPEAEVVGAIPGTPGIGASLKLGLVRVAHSRLLTTTIVSLAVVMLGLGAVNVLFVPLLVSDLQVSPAWFGALDLAQSASMILAAGMIGAIAARFRSTTIVTVGLIGVAVLIALTGAVTAVWQVLLLMFLIGWFVSPLQAAVITMLQLNVEDAERGRIMSVLNASMSAATVLSMAFAGIAGEIVGVRNVFFVAGAICGVGAVISLVGFRGTHPRGVTARPPSSRLPAAAAE
ncbi:MAG TPA: MFS transporter [Candidatus Limnocylindrales bacterium]|nr:MFS transporter [Candidatus Limnocylindrales bacterium]